MNIKIKLKEIKAILADWCDVTSAHGFQFLVSTTHTLWEKLICSTFTALRENMTFSILIFINPISGNVRKLTPHKPNIPPLQNKILYTV